MKPNSHRFLIAGLLLFLGFFNGANFAVVAPVIPLIMDHYDVSRGSASLLTALVIMVQAVFIIPGGMIVVRSPIKLILGLGWLMGCAMIFVPFAGSFLVLLGLRAVFGLGFVLVMPATAPVLMRWFSPRELPIITSLNLTFFTLGIGAGTFLSAPLSELMGWQNTLSLFGWVLLAGLLVWWFFAKVPPAKASAVRSVSLKDMWNSIRSKTTVLLGLADGAGYAQYLALTTWLPTYYNQVFGMSLSKAGFIVGLIPLMGFWATLFGGFLGARTKVRRPFFIVSGLLVGLAGFGTFALDNQPLIYLSVVVLGFASFLYLPVMLTLPMEIEGTTETDVAVMWSTMFAIASFFAVIAPISVGFMTDALGSYVPAFTLWAVFSWGLMVVGFFLPEVRRGAPRVAPASLDADQ